MPRKPPVMCHQPGCTTIVEGAAYCSRHATPTPTRRRDTRQSAAARGYDRDWRERRLRVFVRDRFICRWCGKAVSIGDDVPPADRAHCDHVVPKPLGTDNDVNLQTLCGACHSEKTAAEDGGFGHRPKVFRRK